MPSGGHDMACEVEKIKSALAALAEQSGSGLFGWTLTTETAVSHQALMIGKDGNALTVFQSRQVADDCATLRVFTRHGTPVRQGVAVVTLDPMADPSAQIAVACDASRGVDNPPWNLPAPPLSDYPGVTTADQAVADNPSGEHARLIAVASRESARLKGVQINSAEAYVSFRRLRFESSTGIVAQRAVSEVYFELAAERLPGPNVQEVSPLVEATSVDGLDLPEYFERVAEEACALTGAELPPTSRNATIVIGPEAITALLHELRGQLQADAEYERGPHLIPGDSVADGALAKGGEALTLTLDPFRPAMVESTPFTSEGLSAERGLVIEDGVVRKQLVSARMGQYLGRPANGICGNMLVPLGCSDKAVWLATLPEVLEIRTFSSLLINPRTLTWSSEIKLGRRYRSGHLPVTIKGGVVSGSLRKNLCDCAFSSGRIVRSDLPDGWKSARGYDGPDAMLIRAGVQVAGV